MSPYFRSPRSPATSLRCTLSAAGRGCSVSLSFLPAWHRARSAPVPRFRKSTIATSSTAEVGDVFSSHPWNNIPQHIAEKLGRNLHLQPGHPLGIIRQFIEDYWQQRHAALGGGAPPFRCESDLHPVVSIRHCFDDLLIPPEHVSRRPSDTYYVDDKHVLRTHTSAHQSTLLALKQIECRPGDECGARDGKSQEPVSAGVGSRGDFDAFLVSGDVYRRDEIDRSHYPVFHQMEGVRMFPAGEDGSVTPITAVVDDLKEGLEGMARELFGDVKTRWTDAYFPFTNPSFELEVYYEGEWLEVLGCGVIEKAIIERSGRSGDLEVGWAFGLGLERLAMVLFSIPDIRLFWSKDQRFLRQFRKARDNRQAFAGRALKFKPYSKFPACLKDISFWLPEGAVVSTSESEDPVNRGLNARQEAEDAARAEGRPVFHPNDLFEVVREVAGDLVETVELIDDFEHPTTRRRSQCYRVAFRHMDRNLTNDEIDTIQLEVRRVAASKLRIQLR